VFIGSEMVALDQITASQLRTRYQRLFPDVWAVRHEPLTLTDRTRGAWLWTRRQGVVSGSAAAALHGAGYVDDNVPIEILWPNHRSPPGVIARNDTLLPGEMQWIANLPVTSPERTAFDLARRGPLGRSVEQLDALAHATGLKVEDVLALARLHPHTKGLRRVPGVLDLVDPGAQSPRETWLRLLLLDAGFPRPQTQIPVLAVDGYPRYFLDMGWRDAMIAVEYDGQHHRTDPRQYRDDVIRSEYIAFVGWACVRVVAGDRPREIVRRVERLWASRREMSRPLH